MLGNSPLSTYPISDEQLIATLALPIVEKRENVSVSETVSVNIPVLPFAGNADQFEADGTTPIATGGYSSSLNSSIWLEFDQTPLTESNITLVPKVEVLPIGTGFTKGVTALGNNNYYDPNEPIGLRGAAFAYDTIRKRYIMTFGANGATSHNEVWELKFINGRAKWRQLNTTGTAPTVRYQGGGAFDAVHNRFYTIYGFTTTDTNEVWQIDFNASEDGVWSLTTPAGNLPLARSNVTQLVVNDPTNKCFYVVGGWGASFYNGVYKFDYTADTPVWSVLKADGSASPAPAGIRNGLAVLDVNNGRIIVFGGNTNSTTGVVNTLSAFQINTTTWTTLSPTGTLPTARERHWGYFDTVNRCMVMGMGDDSNTANVKQEMWKLDLTTTNGAWSRIDRAQDDAGQMVTGMYLCNAQWNPDMKCGIIWAGGVDVTADIQHHVLVVDSLDMANSRVDLYGAMYNHFMRPMDATNTNFNSDTNEAVAIGGFSQMQDNGTPGLGGHVTDTFAYAAANTYYFDAHLGISDPINAWTNDNNAFDGSITTSATSSNDATYLLGAGTTAPTSGLAITQVRVRVFGSRGGTGASVNMGIYTAGQATLLGTNSSLLVSPAAWSAFTTLTAPSGGWTWDILNTLEAKANLSNALNQIMNLYRIELEVSTTQSNSWRVATKGYKTFPHREGLACCYDTIGQRFICFGGLWGAGATNKGTFNDTWEIKVGNAGNYVVRRMSPTGTLPGARWLGNAFFDVARNRVLLTMGSNGGTANFNDCWQLDLSSGDGAWTSLTPTGTPPTAAWASGGVNDVVNKKAYIINGSNSALDSTYVQQLLSLDYSGATPAWATLSVTSAPTARRSMGAALDPVNGKIIIFGGYNGTVVLNDINFYSISGNTWSGAATPTTSPAIRRSHGSWWDPVNNVMCITHGRVVSGTWYGDTWRLDPNYTTPASSAWTNLLPKHYIRAAVNVTGLLSNNYHWQGWSTDGTTLSDSTTITYGGNLESAIDFTFNLGVNVDPSNLVYIVPNLTVQVI